MWPPETSSATNGNAGGSCSSSGGEQVTFHVMDADARHPPRVGEAARDRRADQQCPHEARADRTGDAIDRRLDSAFRAHGSRVCFNHRQQLTEMVARGELGHDAAIGRVQFHLAVDLVREQARDAVVDGDGRFVTGGFNAEDPHAFAIPVRRSLKSAVLFPGSATAGVVGRAPRLDQTDRRGFDAQRPHS